jgi:2-succinyl-5-enolpyruvyl-6-hydroxy-3-cyclohexene-1-carboxylate synthase
LVLALHRSSGIRLWTHLDERSMAFFALGMAKALREPVAAVCTSGTAAANFLPAVCEASHGRVPLILLTADRPPEVTHWGAPQTMVQAGLFDPFAKWSATLPAPEIRADLMRHVRATAARAFATAMEGVPGPVHINVPLSEPLVSNRVSEGASVEGGGRGVVVEGRPHAGPFVSVPKMTLRMDPSAVKELARELSSVSKGIIICGPHDTADPSFAFLVTELAGRLGYPILADPLSQVRCGRHAQDHIVDSYDIFLRSENAASALDPEVIIRFGAVTSSKPLMTYLQDNSGCRQILVDRGWRDPFHTSWDRIAADESAFCSDLIAVLAEGTPSAEWSDLWKAVDRRTREAVVVRSARMEELFEGRIFQELSEILPEGSTLLAANSMPVRDLDAFFPRMNKAVHFLGNRGINGIDGLVSTALGAATARRPLVAVLGDTAFYHDMNGLLAAQRHGIHAVFIVLNNDGGGIFSFLPQAEDREALDPLFAMPHGLTFEPAAKLYGLDYARVGSWREFRNAVTRGLSHDRSTVIEVPGDRERNRELHQEIWAAGQEAAGG